MSGLPRRTDAPRGALAFLTVLGGAAPPVAGSTAWFPAVGLALGGVVGTAWLLAGRIFPGSVAAGVALAADLALTGMLHVDGLADAADGLLPPLPRARRLEVMRTPDVGAFGVAVVVVVLGSRWAALAALLAPDGRVAVRRLLLLAGLWAASRALMAATLAVVPYARADGARADGAGGGGLADAFRGDGAPGRVRPLALLAGQVLLAGLACTLALGPGRGVAALAAGLAVGVAVVALAVRRLGGYTGDVLGAAGLLCETAGLLAATARLT